MADFLARIFVVIFIVAYAVVMIGLIGWNLRGGLGRLLKSGWPARILHRFRHSDLSHRTHNAR